MLIRNLGFGLTNKSTRNLTIRPIHKPFCNFASRRMAPIQSAAVAQAHDFLDFVNASPTPYHAVHSAIQRLHTVGFEEIKERDNWATTLKPGGKYYLTRNGSSIVAFGIGKKWKPGNPIAMIGAHTDSPALRIKPVSKKSNAGFNQVGVETYGGGIFHTWFDRDLSIAGRAMVRDGEGNFVQKLVKVDRPILRIPTLAIHLDRSPDFNPNKENELFPITGLVAAELNRTGQPADGRSGDQKISRLESTATQAEDEPFQPLKALSERHHPYVVEIIAEHAGVAPHDVVDFEMILYDTQRACIGGINDELVFSGRLDNLEMTYCSVTGLVESLRAPGALEHEPCARLVACFDHEEVGSTTAQGAASSLLPAVVRRLSALPGLRLLPPAAAAGPGPRADDASGSDASYDRVGRSECGGDGGGEPDAAPATAHEQTLAASFLISADMAHSVNPNYTHKYEADHRPEMNRGTVIKVNANQRYATNSPGIVLLQEVARRARPAGGEDAGAHPPSRPAERTAAAAAAAAGGGGGVPLQLFVVRNDSPCGSTIGPMLSAALGTRTLDLGNAQLSMHSIRECGGVYDIDYAVRLFESFFTHYASLEAKILVD